MVTRAILISALAFVMALSSRAQQPGFTRVDWTLLSADAASRALDVYSTHQMLQNGYHEILLSPSIVDHPARMAAYSGSIVLMNGLVAKMLVRHNHRTMARTLLIIDFAQDSPWAVHNLFLKKRSTQ
jgi:hypothetical protein